MEQKIIEWAKKMVDRFSWLTIKVEHSELFGTVLVEYVYSSAHGDDDEFNSEAMAFEEKLTLEYGDNVPLFTDNGELFTVSSDAEVITKNAILFTSLEVDTAFCLVSQSPLNWLNSNSYNQEDTLEMGTTVKNYTEAYLNAA